MQTNVEPEAVTRGKAIWLTDAATPFILPLAFLLIWQASAALIADSSLLPGPLMVFAALWDEIRSGALFIHIGASLTRALLGFGLACVIGISLGLVMSQSRILRELLAGPIELLRPISAIAWIPLAILWFGIGYASVVFVIMISCVFVILLNTMAAAASVPRDLIDAARTLGAGRWQIFSKVTLPNALPGVFLGMRVALMGAWGGVLIAEMIATREGLGYLSVRAQASFRPDIVLGCMIVVGLIGYSLNALCAWIQRRFIHV